MSVSLSIVISYNIEYIINSLLRLSYTHAFYSKHDLYPRFKQESCLTGSQYLFWQFSKLNKLLNEWWIKEEITEEIMKYFKLNDNENRIYQNLKDAANIILRGKCIVINIYIINKKIKINRISFYLKKLERKGKYIQWEGRQQ